MIRELAGKRAILTGASSGIGRALANELVTAKTRLIIAARNAENLEQVAADLCRRGGEVHVQASDLCLAGDRERLIQAAVQRLGGIDLLINAAGVASFGHFATSTEAINRRVMEVNFFAPVELTRLAMPYLSDGDQPAVVYITSMCGRRGMPAWPEYSASKFALVGIAEAFRAEFMRFGVDTITIVPGLTRTEFGQHLLRNEGKMDIPFHQGMSPEEVAQRTVKAIRRGQTEVILGREARKILLMNKFFPRLLNRLIARRVRQLYESA